MPTPVSIAKQCLNAEASHALDEAVKLTRHRGHAQTTSLHAVSAFLSLSPSQLREACIRARNTAFYPRVQLKALDFCLSVSLDRLPTSQPRVVDEPSVSNSLMAAIKRSQANQRRQPDSLITVKNPNQHLGQSQEQQLGTCSSGIKVELQHLVVSILDDPIVSRVFNDAGFRSFDVKLAILRPFQNFFRYSSRIREHKGVFLCNLDGHSDPGYRRFQFPFSGNWESPDHDEDYRRIGEVLVRKKGRNPLLVGACAIDVLRGFVEVLERRKELHVLPLEVRGINVVSIEKDVLKFANENWSDEAINLRFREVDLMVEHCLGPGLMVSFGNLTCFLDGKNGFRMDALNSVVRKLTELLEVHGSRVWLIGSAANDQTYMEFLSRFSSIDKDWDLQLLPISSVKPPIGESCFKSSLMGSFVPFGGFFSSPSDMKSPFSRSYQYVTRSNLGNEKLEQEVAAFSKRGSIVSASDKHQTAFSPWLQMGELGANNTLEYLKAKGGTMLQGATVAGLQRKWNDVHQHPHHTRSSLEHEIYRDCSRLPTALSFHSLEEKLKNVNSQSSISGVDDGQPSPSSGISMVTDLGLELFSQPSKQQKKANTDVENSGQVTTTRTNRGWVKFTGESDGNNFKTLFKALFGRLGRQCEALRVISQVITHSWRNRGDIWLNFTGLDMFGKRRTALFLAEVLYGSKNNFIHVDLCSKHGFNPQIINSDVRFRGKTVVDHIADELRKKPFCVIFLENLHSADPMAQGSLLHAIRNGRFSDSHGREVSVNNRIFILTSRSTEDNNTDFPEERIARAKSCPLQIFVKGDGNYYMSNQDSALIRTGQGIANQIFFNKRKLSGSDVGRVKRPNRISSMSLDLNLPAGVSEDDETNSGYERSDPWLEGFSDEVDKTLVKVGFDPFDYDALAMRIMKWVNESFDKVVGLECLLEIEASVMDQILAAACLSEGGDKDVEDWIDQVLGKAFAEAKKRYQLTANSAVILATCGALCAEEQAQEGCLPLRIVFT